MNVLISGATGLIGSALTRKLEAQGHVVTRLTRSPKIPGDVRWDPERGVVEGDLGRTEAVVHLAGESIAQGRWTPEKKRRIRESRVRGTRLLAEKISALDAPPGVMVSMSAVGYYGSRGDEVLTEESSSGTDFLAGVCREWEAAAEPARRAGIRVVHPRLGIVLSPEGGALGATLPIFKLGGGGKIGDGRQWWSWVAFDDVVGSIIRSIEDTNLSGPVNVGSPNPMTNAQYTKVLGRVLGRPTVLPLPAPAARIMLGGVADALLLASQRMEPRKLQNTGYPFRYPDLEGALRHLLGK